MYLPLCRLLHKVLNKRIKIVLAIKNNNKNFLIKKKIKINNNHNNIKILIVIIKKTIDHSKINTINQTLKKRKIITNINKTSSSKKSSFRKLNIKLNSLMNKKIMYKKNLYKLFSFVNLKIYL